MQRGPGGLKRCGDLRLEAAGAEVVQRKPPSQSGGGHGGPDAAKVPPQVVGARHLRKQRRRPPKTLEGGGGQCGKGPRPKAAGDMVVQMRLGSCRRWLGLRWSESGGAPYPKAAGPRWSQNGRGPPLKRRAPPRPKPQGARSDLCGGGPRPKVLGGPVV